MGMSTEFDHGETTGAPSNVGGPLQNVWTAVLLQNVWAAVLVGLVAVALVAGFGLAYLPHGLLRDAAFWTVMAVGAFMILAAVGWAFTEIRTQERLSAPTSDRRRVLGYLGILVVVAAIAVGAALTPRWFVQVISLLCVPIVLVAWWRREHSRRHRRTAARR